MRARLEDESERGRDEDVRQALIRQRALGVAFRHRWGDIARAPLPDDIRALIQELDARKSAKRGKRSRSG